ncbi:uncharacterized [Tachysurus ichikawai]
MQGTWQLLPFCPPQRQSRALANPAVIHQQHYDSEAFPTSSTQRRPCKFGERAKRTEEEEERGKEILLNQPVSNLELLTQPLNQNKESHRWFNQCIM